jgi:hypothetical protein
MMSDAVDYLHAYAVRAICKARRMPFGKSKRLQRAVGRIYLLLTKEASIAPNVDHLEDFRAARRREVDRDTSGDRFRRAARRGGASPLQFAAPLVIPFPPHCSHTGQIL